jgi:multidrug efflux pump subunit AcrA (membrane-fusion protein)
LTVALAGPACNRQQSTIVATPVSEPVKVQVTKPQTRDIVRVVGQPSFVESYERTSIYPKLSGYIKKWYVDIGDRVKKNQALADLFVPEVEEDCQTKLETVELAKERVKLAEEKVKVADADVKVAAAHLEAAKEILDQYEAQVARWDKEVKRLGREVKPGHVDARILDESEHQLKSSKAARDAALAEIERADADLQSKSATFEENEVGVEVAEAAVEVAKNDYERVKALVDWYLKLYAPFDGVVVARNANTWDFVLPETGDPSADHLRLPDKSPSHAAPVYVIDRTDVVRVFVDIPEHDANFVRAGTKASVVVRAFLDEPVLGAVTRTSWALNVKSRTLRAEIDLPNTGNKIPLDLPRSTYEAITKVKMPKTDAEILPGMYAYGKVIIERPVVWALPAAALTHDGDHTFYWSYKNGKATRTEVQTGVSDGQWVEVTNRRLIAPDEAVVYNTSLRESDEASPPLPTVFGDDAVWTRMDGSEQVILGDLASLTDGAAVEVASGAHESEVAGAQPCKSEVASAAAAKSEASNLE